MNQISIKIANDKVNELDTVNLTNCDREPIHIPNYIQPQGLLLALAEPDLRITRVSENAPEILGMPALELLDRPLVDFIGRDRGELIESIRACLDRSFEHINPLNLSIANADGVVSPFNGIVHRAPSDEIILELEPVKADSESDFFQFYRHIKVTLAKMQTTQNLAALCDLVVQEMRELTGFDRVMIYRFNEGGDGSVIAESKQDNLETFLGMHYPDSDIPKQAKYLYTLNWLRLIPDVNYQQIGLVSNDETTSHPLDMSYCGLRAVSPLHIE
jgi:two-component system, chemotaxis family, sensor kinase Cph1